MNQEDLEYLMAQKVQNLQNTVEILLKGWNNCSFISPNNAKKYEEFLKGLKYLLFERKLTLETLFKFQVGFGEEVYKDEQQNLQRIVSIYYPMFGPKENKTFLKNEAEIKLVKIKSRGLLPENKKYQRIIPSGAEFGVFGLNTLSNRYSDLKSIS